MAASLHTAAHRELVSTVIALRKRAGMTQRQLAAKIRQSQWWVARIETGGRRVDVAEFIEFCLGCGVEPDQAIRQLTRLRR